MSRLLPVSILCCTIAIGATAYAMLGEGPADRIQVPSQAKPMASSAANPVAGATTGASTGPAAELQQARRSGSKPALDAIVEVFQTAVTAAPNDRNSWHLLAEALLERVLQRSHLCGIVIGTPRYENLPAEVAEDLDAGTAAIARARELGDDSGDLFRLEAAVMSHRITGLATALQWNGRIQQALAKAGERAKDDPRLHVALGLRKLLVPKFLGQDASKALEHFEFAAGQMLDDERPAVFAAMANLLQEKRQQAIAWLTQAVQQNPQNTFAKVVLARVQRGEPDPFGRDVTAAEASSTK